MKHLPLIWFAITAASLPGTNSRLSPQDPPTNKELFRKFARHFDDRPPVKFEFEATGDHAGRILATNTYQQPLTAIAIEIARAPESKLPPQTNFFDSLTRSALRAPVPQGLTFVSFAGHEVGKPFPEAKLVAAIWEDGSTYGSSDVLNLILEGRRNTLSAFDRTLSILQSGMDEGWTIAQYLNALEVEKPPNTSQKTMDDYQVQAAATAVYFGAKSTISSQADKGKKLSHVVTALQKALKQQRDQLADSAPAL